MKEKTSQCPSCGKPIKEEYNVCPYCGTSLKIICKACGKELKPEYNACPYCGASIKSNTPFSKEKHSQKDINKKIASILTSIGALFLFIGKAIKKYASKIIIFSKPFAQKALQWIKSIDWQKSKDFFEKIGKALLPFMKKGFAWTKQTFTKCWVFIKKSFARIQDSLANLLEKKFAHETSTKIARGILITSCALCLLLVISLISGSFNKKEVSINLDQNSLSSTSIPEEASQPAVNPAEQKWLVMIYADADDKALEEDIHFDINEVEAADTNDRVQVVVQLDRYAGGYDGDGDWSGTHRYLITPDDDLDTINSEMVADLGELDMGSSDTLVEFATWAIQTYPADRYVLILSDHGSGWTGGWFDHDPQNPSGNFISLDQLDAALGDIRDQTGIGKFELVGLDACLMGMLEVYSGLSPHSHYAVASEEYEPSMGWAYQYFLSQLAEQPEMDGAELAQVIVDSYISQDLRIHDRKAYEELLAAYNLPNEVDEALMAEKLAERVTLSAIDLTLLPTFNSAFNQFIQSLTQINQGSIAEARSFSQSFLNIFDDGKPSPFIDLENFLDIIGENSTDKTVLSHIEDVKSIYEEMVIAEVHGENLPAASGISIYFPISDHYWNGGNYSYEWYPVTTNRFAQDSYWDDFLAFHYADQDFGAGIPELDSKAVAPGYSEIIISPPVITPDVVSINDPRINIQADIRGDRIAYLYLVSLYKYDDRYLFFETDMILGDDYMDINGTIYPIFKRDDGIIHIDLDYEINATGITDGHTAAFAVLEPESYGIKPEETIYSVKGFYIDSQTGEKVSARMYFYNYGNNEMRNIVGYFGSSESNVAPAEIVPKKGDQFQFVDTWWVVDSNGNIIDELRDGNTLTFGDQPFQHGVASQFISPGNYSIGIGAEDMDGNQTFSFASITVESENMQ